jgi:hypothetical protein
VGFVEILAVELGSAVKVDDDSSWPKNDIVNMSNWNNVW